MRVGWRSEPKCGGRLTLKLTSFDNTSIKGKCVQIVKEILGIYKDWKENGKKRLTS